VSAGDDPAAALADFEAFVREHQARVRRQLQRLVGDDAALADDLAQEAFVRAWLHRAQFRGQAQAGTWLYRIAYNVYLAHVRGAPPAAVDEAIEPTAPEADALLPIDLARALARLPEPERVALLHCYLLDLSHSEAAELLGWPLGTLKSHVSRGKARLADMLAAWRPHGEFSQGDATS
jgi:RNA polymerase sigma factor (sigma-70 family)